MAKALKEATDVEIKAELWTIEQTIRQFSQQRELLLKELTDRANQAVTPEVVNVEPKVE